MTTSLITTALDANMARYVAEPPTGACVNLYYGAWLDNFSDVLTSGHTALDIGCGHGHDTRALLNASLRVVALDLNPDNIRRAVVNAPAAAFAIADLRTGIPFRAATFSVVVASLCLHYFDRATTDRILRDIQRVMTPGASLLARVNVVGDVPSLWGEGIEHEPDFFEVEPGRFKRFFSESSLTDALAPYFTIATLVPKRTLVNGQVPKQTLVVRAIRRDG